MSTKHTSTCLQKAADDEPIFVLRAQDVSSPAAIKEWIRLNKDNPGIDPMKLINAWAISVRMEEWHTRKQAD